MAHYHRRIVQRPLPPLVAVALSGLLAAPGVFAQTAPAPDATPLPQRLDEMRPTVLPGLRFGFGAHVPLSAPTPSDTSFVFDLHAGVGLYPNGDRLSVVLVPELGYSHDTSSTRGGDFFTAGFLAMYGTMFASFGLAEHAVFGDSMGTGALGLRSALVAQLLATSLTLEVGHQWTSVGGEDRHDFRVIAAINPVPLLRLLTWASSAASR